ncbi:MAG: BREX system P-loop protein BrxC [Smithella sp.]|nr:BREX system P-loop protein BrxC [Smithella sp.]
MTLIRNLFDSSRAINRKIEKVITYQNRSEAQLKTEISEYVVTERIEESFSDLLKKMQTAMQEGGGHEIGVWVSGFYGSGKSSFTKYLGFALDREMKVGDDKFIQLLQNQLHTASVRALFNTVANSYDAVVIFLDLASEMLAGASMEDISTVLYLKVLQWAGYSEDLKVAELERMLESDGKQEAFLKRAKQELDGIEWKEVHNQPLVANSIAARLASEFYPKLFHNNEEFQNLNLHVNKSEIKRSEEMIELIRRKSGKQRIIFIVDEVGQYVSSKQNLILNLDGLAKNLKQIGNGTVWIFATAQQTLTEDHASAVLNAPGLFKLKDRFPIQINLEASDIKEICHKRLLTKSASGEKELGNLFDSSGASLRTATQLKDGGIYETELIKKAFVDLYPFLPAHFEILLQLLGRLARKTGGLGLRSAIKVLQDVLITRSGHIGANNTLADEPVGTLANTVTFYNTLRKDIQSSYYGYIIEGVDRVIERFPNASLYHDVAKSIAILQILENLPVTAHNIAALLHPSVNTASLKDDVEKAIDAMLKDEMIPLGEKNNSLRFLTQAAITLQKQFDLIEYRQVDVRAEHNGVLRNIFKPLPAAKISGIRPVTAGLKVVMGGGQSTSLDGEKEAIQIHVEFVPIGNYDSSRTERENDSRTAKELKNIYLLGRTDPSAEQLAVTLVRCKKFLDQHRTTSDSETQEFVRIVDAKFTRAFEELENKIRASLIAGSFVAHGAHKPVTECGADLLEAAKTFLADIAGRVFDRYSEAALQAESGLAEKFLKTRLDRVTHNDDPLGLVSMAGGTAQIKTDHKAIVSIRDYLSQQGQVEGRRLLEHFADAPFGWSKDTTRYILAGAFVGTEIKLRIAGQDYLVKNDETVAAFASNKALSAAGIALRKERPDPEALIRASDRLRDLSGENILPLEADIAAAAKKHFPTYQSLFGPFAVELRSLGFEDSGQAEKAENLAGDLTEVVSGDGSDAVHRLGGAESPLHDSLLWARNLKKALDNGLRTNLIRLKRLRGEIESLPETGIPAKLRESSKETLDTVADILGRDAFFDEAPALASSADDLDKRVAETTNEIAAQQKELVETELKRWQESADWMDLNEDDRNWFITETDALVIEADTTLDGLRQLLNHEYSLNHRLRELAATVAAKAKMRKEEQKKSKKEEARDENGETIVTVKETTVIIPKVFQSANQIETLVEELKKLRSQINKQTRIRIVWKEIE